MIMTKVEVKKKIRDKVLEFEKIEKINTRWISYVWNSFEEWSVRIKGKNDQFKKNRVYCIEANCKTHYSYHERTDKMKKSIRFLIQEKQYQMTQLFQVPLQMTKIRLTTYWLCLFLLQVFFINYFFRYLTFLSQIIFSR